MIKQLRDKANLLLKSSNNDINNIKLSIIKKILEDDTCFFKMTRTNPKKEGNDRDQDRD